MPVDTLVYSDHAHQRVLERAPDHDPAVFLTEVGPVPDTLRPFLPARLRQREDTRGARRVWWHIPSGCPLIVDVTQAPAVVTIITVLPAGSYRAFTTLLRRTVSAKEVPCGS